MKEVSLVIGLQTEMFCSPKVEMEKAGAEGEPEIKANRTEFE